MDDRRVSELEAAVADLGPLLVRLEKYRAGRGAAAEGLRREALALGDEARRLHRRGTLDDATVPHLLDATRALHQRLAAAIRGVQRSPAYRTAVAAHARGDQQALAPAVLAIFADLEAVVAPPALHATVAWRRSGRPIPPATLAAEVAAVGADGLPGEGDDLAAGTDPELPVVALHADPPPEEPVVLRFAGAALPPVYRLGDAGEHLVYAARLRAPFTVVLADPGDEQPRVELDFPAWRAALHAELRARNIRADAP